MSGSDRAIRNLYQIIEPALPVLVVGSSAASTGFTSDRYIRTLETLTPNSKEATCAFRSGPPEYRRKLGEQCTTMNNNGSVVVRIEGFVRVVCVTVVTFTWPFVQCIVDGAMVDFGGEKRGSHC